MIERYEITGKAGQGGVGAVYRAYDHQLGRVVALKRLLPQDESELDDTSDHLLAKEANLMSSITHPNIIGVYDTGVDEDGAFVVMEYVDGETLDETVARSAFTEEDFVNLAEQCLDGLIAAQEIGMLHRDIKPSNLMIRWLPTGRFQVKIVDFGLAKLTFKPTIQTINHGDAILGSIYFLAPEQFERRPLDKRTDLYALGCVFYYALTQQYPFYGDNAATVMMAHLEHNLTPLNKFRPDLSEPIVDWVNRLLSRNMEDRPADAAEAMAELGRVSGSSDRAPRGASPSAPPSDTHATQAVPSAQPQEAEAPPGSTTRLITSKPGSARKLVTASVTARATGRISTGGAGPGTTSRINKLPESPHHADMKKFGIILACAVPVLLLIFFLVSRSAS